MENKFFSPENKLTITSVSFNKAHQYSFFKKKITTPIYM